MYATVRGCSGPAEFGEELVKRQDDVRRALEGIAGFQDYYLLQTDDGGVLTVSVCDECAGTDESVRQAAEWIRANLPDMGVSPPEVTTGEVGIHFGVGARAAGIAQPELSDAACGTPAPKVPQPEPMTRLTIRTGAPPCPTTARPTSSSCGPSAPTTSPRATASSKATSNS